MVNILTLLKRNSINAFLDLANKLVRIFLSQSLSRSDIFKTDYRTKVIEPEESPAMKFSEDIPEDNSDKFQIKNTDLHQCFFFFFVFRFFFSAVK